MAGASAEGEQNPWPAFVDVLTTVIMVVTFLLVIMSAAVMQASQAAIDEIRESVSAEAMEIAQARIRELEAQILQMTNGAGATDGTSAAALRAVELTQLQASEGDLRRAVASRSQTEEGRFVVQSEQDEPVEGGNIVQSADVLFTLEFDPEAVRVGTAVQEQAMALIERADIPPGAALEIWSEAPTTSTVSEAERLAYYRALVARNILIRAGIPATSITAQVRAIEAVEGVHAVRVIVKP
jgi:hypothetical protein